MLNPLRLVKAPAPVLDTAATEVQLDDDLNDELIEVGRARYPVLAVLNHMSALMHAKGGIGLAANQVGILKRLVVIDGALARQAGIPWALVNPSFTPFEEDGDLEGEEGCLSYPGVRKQIRRWRRGNLGWATGGDGSTYGRIVRTIDLEQNGFAVIVVQHELDHLAGRCAVAP